MVSSTIFDLSAFHARHHATTDFQSAIYRFDSGGHCYFFGYRAILASIFRAAAVVAADLKLDCSLAHHLDDSGFADFSISSCLLVVASLFAHYLCHGDFNLLSSNLFCNRSHQSLAFCYRADYLHRVFDFLGQHHRSLSNSFASFDYELCCHHLWSLLHHRSHHSSFFTQFT